jgi:uncharacterized protein (UPF0276 family)
MPVIQLSADLSDAHQPLLKDDYDLLEFILAKTHPQVVTLEYIQEADALREQLGRLRSISVMHSATSPPSPVTKKE